MEKYNAAYKCRLCNEKYAEKKIYSNRLVEILIEAAQYSPTDPQRLHLLKVWNLCPSQIPYLINSHTCKDGSVGVTDFVGFVKAVGKI